MRPQYYGSEGNKLFRQTFLHRQAFSSNAIHFQETSNSPNDRSTGPNLRNARRPGEISFQTITLLFWHFEEISQVARAEQIACERGDGVWRIGTTRRRAQAGRTALVPVTSPSIESIDVSGHVRAWSAVNIRSCHSHSPARSPVGFRRFRPSTLPSGAFNFGDDSPLPWLRPSTCAPGSNLRCMSGASAINEPG